MKESSKILLYGLLASILLILLCLYTHQDEFIIKDDVEKENIFTEKVEVSNKINHVKEPVKEEKNLSKPEVPQPSLIRVTQVKEENQSKVDDSNRTGIVEQGIFKDKNHIQLMEREKVEKVEKEPEIADKNLPIEDNKPLIDNEHKKEKEKEKETLPPIDTSKKITKKELKKEKKNVSISSIQEKISTITNRNISFYKSKAKITSKGKVTLNKIIPLLKKVPHAKIIVKGYTDASGKESINLWISQERAKSVRKYLGKHGISLKNIVAKGYGESELLYGDKPYSKLNRRVEIELKKGK